MYDPATEKSWNSLAENKNEIVSVSTVRAMSIAPVDVEGIIIINQIQCSKRSRENEKCKSYEKEKPELFAVE